MDTLNAMLSGFEVALSWHNLMYCLIGVLVGNIVGVLPGLGPTATISLLLPFAFTLPPESSIIMMAGIYYGAMYGGSITSTLLDLPGEAASVVTTFDGYQMTKQGRAGIALGIAAIGSFVAGTLAVIGLSFLAPGLAGFAVRFGAPEYAVLTTLGILLVAYLGTKSFLKSALCAAFGLLLATIGQDPITGSIRLTFGSNHLLGGIDFAAMAMGVFGVGEILYNLEHLSKGTLKQTKVGRVWPTVKDFAQAKWAILRGSIIGFFVGILPGGGSIIATVASYGVEKKVSKTPERFGKGAIEGVAGPESANNAAAGAAFIPLLTLGIPSDAVMALIFGTLLLNGITPGPQLIGEHPDLFWGVVSSMYIGNALLLLLNLPFVGLFIQLLRVRSSILMAFAVVLTLIGVYSLGNDSFNMGVVLFFGVLGYLMRKAGFDPAPMVLAFVLGKILEGAFRQSLIMSNGDFAIFATRPLSGGLLGLAAIGVLYAAASRVWKARRRSGGKELKG
ncbi:putative tricarboxylic transport membrane protein [Cohnella sp. OV330]|uniref:tripartite tricarboxylate transporter permease n=1 Tax=Cohnella sp. OV330 TaxID=1855288 RepID=UPI0008E96C8E|nr:tripartite tricarboxylate transporter permease [Cohnella sp. OV330]SFB49892.1 putative tricarboxylic transport membrane protein [Cohnella sp. OV330]